MPGLADCSAVNVTLPNAKQPMQVSHPETPSSSGLILQAMSPLAPNQHRAKHQMMRDDPQALESTEKN